MTYEELLQAHKEQTPLVWDPSSVIDLGWGNRSLEIVTLPEPPPPLKSGLVSISRAAGKTAYAYHQGELLRVATAQDLLEYGDQT